MQLLLNYVSNFHSDYIRGGCGNATVLTIGTMWRQRVYENWRIFDSFTINVTRKTAGAAAMDGRHPPAALPMPLHNTQAHKWGQNWRRIKCVIISLFILLFFPSKTNWNCCRSGRLRVRAHKSSLNGFQRFIQNAEPFLQQNSVYSHTLASSFNLRSDIAPRLIFCTQFCATHADRERH